MTVSSSCSSPVPVERLQRGALGFSSSAASSKCECECRTDTKKLQSRVGIRCLCEPRLQPTLGNEIRMPSGIQYTEAGCQVLHLPFQEIHTFCQYCTTLWPIVYIHLGPAAKYNLRFRCFQVGRGRGREKQQQSNQSAVLQLENGTCR